jgi:tetratricopeptide (TPR) repeat protein
MSRYQLAFQTASQALPYAIKAKNYSTIISSYKIIAMCKEGSEDYSNAIDAYAKAIKIILSQSKDEGIKKAVCATVDDIFVHIL